MIRLLADEFVRVTESAAIACSRLMGKGDKDAADQLAVDAMRQVLNTIDIKGRIVIGEGERDEAPMLFIGEEVGTGNGIEIDIAVDPLEGTNLAAAGQPNSIAVLAASEKGGLLHAPDTYMEKLVVRSECIGNVDIRKNVKQNIEGIARGLNRDIQDLTIVVLDRPRHSQLISDIRATGARIKLITDGDIMGAVSAVLEGTNIHALMGIGAAPEGVIAAAAIKCMGGEIQARMRWRSEEEKQRAEKMGIDTNPDKVYFTNDLAPGKNIIFSATGVTNGEFLNGVHLFNGGARTSSILVGNDPARVRFLNSVHIFNDNAYPIRLL